MSAFSPRPLKSLSETFLPVATPSQECRELLQSGLVDLVKPIEHGAVDVNNGHHLVVRHYGHDDLALTVAVARDMAGKLVDVTHQLRGPRRGGGSAHAAAEVDGLAGHLALEGAEYESRPLRRPSHIKCVETCGVGRDLVRKGAEKKERRRREIEPGEGGTVPAQLTWVLGSGRDLYACHSNDAALDRLLVLPLGPRGCPVYTQWAALG